MVSSNVAQFPGTCVECRGRINKGDSFSWGSERGTRKHVDCTRTAVVESIATAAIGAISANTPQWAPSADDDGGLIIGAPALPAMAQPSMIWSVEQNNFFDALDTTSDNLMLDACPGGGKTTTGKEGAIRTQKKHPGARIGFFAFNAKIAAELKTKLAGTGIEASTIHAYWFKVWTRHLNRQINPTNKVMQIGRQLVRSGQLDRETSKKYLKGAVQLVDKAKSVAGIGIPGLAPDTDETWIDLLERFEITFEGSNVVTGIELAKRLLRLSNEDLGSLDFADMLYLPALHGVTGTPFDFVFVDEAQDFNPIRRYLLKPMLGDNGRLIAIGDPDQSIYGFSGADSDAMDQIQVEYRCRRLPLATSYRCPKAVVQIAQPFMPRMQSAPDAPDGIVSALGSWSLDQFKQTDAILCRNNAPLVQLAYKLLTAHIPCKMLGKDIGAGLVNLINKMDAVDVDDLQERLTEYRSIEMARLLRRDEEAKADALNDKVESIFAAIAGMTGYRSVDGVIDTIESIFANEDTTGVLVLSTVHKAKGGEWPTVYILDRGLMPSAYAKTPEQQKQESNLQGVAYTRAMHALYLIESRGLR